MEKTTDQFANSKPILNLKNHVFDKIIFNITNDQNIPKIIGQQKGKQLNNIEIKNLQNQVKEYWLEKTQGPRPNNIVGLLFTALLFTFTRWIFLNWRPDNRQLSLIVAKILDEYVLFLLNDDDLGIKQENFNWNN